MVSTTVCSVQSTWKPLILRPDGGLCGLGLSHALGFPHSAVTPGSAPKATFHRQHPGDRSAALCNFLSLRPGPVRGPEQTAASVQLSRQSCGISSDVCARSLLLCIL